MRIPANNNVAWKKEYGRLDSGRHSFCLE